MRERGFINIYLPDGVYPFYIRETSWENINELPEQDGVYNSVEVDYPDFTVQVVEGFLRIENGKLDLDDLDSQIPSTYGDYNTHIFLEGLYFEGARVRLMMGS